jgi:hypothetical protein
MSSSFLAFESLYLQVCGKGGAEWIYLETVIDANTR